MKTLFVMSDVHGFYDEMKRALKENGWERDNPDHIFVHCGDLLDRGWKPGECLKFVNGLPKERKILIRGNHEDLMDEAIVRRHAEWHDHSNGTTTTAQLLTNESNPNIAFDKMKNCKPYQTYTRDLVDYARVGSYVFVHGWVPTTWEGDKKSNVADDWEIGDWEGARWKNGMQEWSDGAVIEGKTIVCGHWHTSWGHSHLHNACPEWGDARVGKPIFDPFIDKGIVALDACTAHSGKCNCYRIELEGEIK